MFVTSKPKVFKSAKEIVWKVEQNDLPGITLAWVTRVERLPNGNTMIGNCHAGPDNPQFIEVTPDKKVVWALRSWSAPASLGPSTIIQLLDEPGISENVTFGEFK